jgi:hypothetical protein
MVARLFDLWGTELFRPEPIAGRSGTRQKSLDLPQLLTQLGFDRHRQVRG